MRIALVVMALALSGCAANGQYAYSPTEDPMLWMYVGNQMMYQSQIQTQDIWNNYYRSQQRINQIGDQYQQQLNQSYENQRLIDAINGR